MDKAPRYADETLIYLAAVVATPRNPVCNGRHQLLFPH